MTTFFRPWLNLIGFRRCSHSERTACSDLQSISDYPQRVTDQLSLGFRRGDSTQRVISQINGCSHSFEYSQMNNRTNSIIYPHPDDALRALADRLTLTDIEKSLGSSSATGRVLAEDVVADRDSPAADVSAMDGYAIRLNDLQHVGAISVRGESVPGLSTAKNARRRGRSHLSPARSSPKVPKRWSNAKTPKNSRMRSVSASRRCRRSPANTFDALARTRRRTARF